MKGRVFVVRLVDHEPDESLDTGPDQQTVHQGNVVTDQEGRSFEGNVLLAHDLDTVNGMGEEPERKADKKVRQYR
jgi:hypothetical protein